MNKYTLFEWCLEQAQKIVAAYRAEVPEGFEAFNQSYSSTTPEQHRQTLIATLSNPNPRVREAAQAELDQMERGTQHQQVAATQAQQLMEFMDRQQQTGRQFEESRKDREQRAEELKAYRQEGEATRGEAAHERNLNALVHLAQNSMDPKVQAMANSQIARMMGMDSNVTPASPGAASVAQHLVNTNEPGARPLTAPATTAPAGAAPPTTPPAVPPVAAVAPAPTAEQTILANRATGKPYVEGNVYNPPPGTAGKDFNVSTGQWVPSSMVGTIGGRPAGQVLAEGALRTGVTPESPTGLAALRGIEQNTRDRAGGLVGPGTPTTPPGYTGGPATAPGSTPWTPAQLAVGRRPLTDNVGAATTPAAVPTSAPTQFGSGAMSSGTHSGEWLANQFADLGRAVGAHISMQTGGPAEDFQMRAGGGQPQPPGRPTPEELARQTVKQVPANAGY